MRQEAEEVDAALRLEKKRQLDLEVEKKTLKQQIRECVNGASART